MLSIRTMCRRGRVVLMIAVLFHAFQIDSIDGFVVNSVRTNIISNYNTIISSSSCQHRGEYKSELRAITGGNDRSVARHYERRMTHEEQMELLRKSVEARRIRTIKTELTAQLGSVSTTPLTIALSRATGYGEELDLLETAIVEGESAREALVTGNMGLVHFCVNDILNKRQSYRSSLKSLSKEDLIQEGAIGLARAVDKWNPNIGGKFSTYAVYWIRAAVLRCIAARDDFVRVPEHVSAAVRKVTRAAQTLGLNIDDYDDNVFLSAQWREANAAKALAEEAGLTDQQLVEAMKVRKRRITGIMSFEPWMQNKKHYETDLISQEAFVDRSVAEYDSSSLSLDDSTHLKAILGKFLRPKEIEALSWRYGLNDKDKMKCQRDYVKDAERELFPSVSNTSKSRKPQMSSSPVRGKWGEAMSFSEVGNQMQVSAEYGRKLCHVAISKLQHAAEEGLLELAFLF
jgi:RNA polymerase sigma factor (sigma-70 family)